MKDNKKTYILLLIFNFSLLLFHSPLYPPLSESISVLLSSLYKAEKGFETFCFNLSDELETLKEAHKVIKERDKLLREIGTLRLEKIKLLQELERQRLCKGRLYPSIFYAKTVFLNIENLNTLFFIGAGKNQGIKEGMAVVDMEGNAVGKIIGPVKYALSPVRPMTHPLSVIGAKVKDYYGVVRGNGSGVLDLDYIYPTSKIKIGDEVLTSGLDGIFPVGIKIGRIIFIEKGKGLFLKIKVKPFFHLKTLRFAGVIRRW